MAAPGGTFGGLDLDVILVLREIIAGVADMQAMRLAGEGIDPAGDVAERFWWDRHGSRGGRDVSR